MSSERTSGRVRGACLPRLTRPVSGIAARFGIGAADTAPSPIAPRHDPGSRRRGLLAPSRAVQTAIPAGLGWAGPGVRAQRFLQRNLLFEPSGTLVTPLAGASGAPRRLPPHAPAAQQRVMPTELG
jgi:hypothetical protein